MNKLTNIEILKLNQTTMSYIMKLNIINYYESEDFNRAVFTIEDGEVVEHALSDLCRDYAEETTSPRGIEPRFHLRGNELWAWGFGTQKPYLVMTFDNKEDAKHALYLSFRYDLYSSGKAVYNTHEEANSALLEFLED